MDGEQAHALVRAASDGVDCDDLRVTSDDDGYAFEVADERATGLDEAELRDVARDHADYVTNWYVWDRVAPDADDRRAFLRWVEGADERSVPERYEALREGVEREWGQLLVRATLGDDGRRRYELRHRADADAARADLTVHEEPSDARTVAKHDDDGRYRPLKTAPTLQTGWAFPDLSGADLVRTVDFFYPATIANWHLERTGDLDVSHWRATAERQTGIYDVISELPDDAVGWMAEACCADSQCCKRREWDLDEDDELDAPRGDGVFPCREPCSLVIAAARKFTTLESEESRTYELELTLSEKNQLAEIIDAVADGTVDEIREADVYDGANRYRTRYLRAKRFDDDGGLAAERVDEGHHGHDRDSDEE